jgi:uncharacterized RDD family membrane protein YckC
MALLLLVTGLEFSWPTETPAYLQLAFLGFSPIDTIVLFAYWTLAEWYLGSSIGKFITHTRVLRDNGQPHNLLDSAIQSFGKTFLLFIDFPLGLLYPALREKRQRLFNHLSRTIVVRTPFQITSPGTVTLTREP